MFHGIRLPSEYSTKVRKKSEICKLFGRKMQRKTKKNSRFSQNNLDYSGILCNFDGFSNCPQQRIIEGTLVTHKLHTKAIILGRIFGKNQKLFKELALSQNLFVYLHRVSLEHDILFAQIPTRITTSTGITSKRLSTFGVRIKNAFLRST